MKPCEEENEALCASRSGRDSASESLSDSVQLDDLPDHVIVYIFSYLGHDFLRYTAPTVSKLFRRLARSRALWSKAALCYDDYDVWDDSITDKFLEDLKLTPYLHSLRISILGDEYDPRVLPALLQTTCKIYQLILKVVVYNPEILMFLQKHPEIRELNLGDLYINDHNGHCRGAAAIVASLAAKLTLLDLCQSRLMELPQLFAVPTEEGPWSPSADSAVFPAGAEPPCLEEDNEEALDLREGEERSEGMLPRGLRKLRYKPTTETDLDNPNVTKNLVSIIRMYSHSLVDVRVDWPKAEVYQALAECRQLTSMSVTLNGSACASFSAVMEAMESPPTTVHLGLRLPLRPGELAYALRSLGARGPPMDELEIEVLSLHTDGSVVADAQTNIFPGFGAMEGLLQQRGLRKLVLTRISPVGRADLLELASMAPASLRRLEMAHVNCSRSGTFVECRDRVDAELRAALPGLEVDVFCNFFDDGYDAGFKDVKTCRCERRRSGWGAGRRSRGRGRDHRGRGGAQ